MYENRFIWRLFARENPVLAPRRKKSTAERWVAVARHICRYLHGIDWDAMRYDMAKWGAGAILDAGSWIARPDGYEPFGDGSLRRQAQDAGGIEGQALLALAEVMAGLCASPSERDWRCWAILYPRTASLAERFSSPIPEEVVGEWELIPAAEDGELEAVLPRSGADEIRPADLKDAGDQVIE